MVALGLQDLWATGLGPKWALRLPEQRTQGWADNHLLQIIREGGDSAKRRVTGDRSQRTTARRTAEKETQTKVRTKSQRLAVQRLYG